VDSGTGALTPLAPATYATGAGPSSVVVEPSGKFIYVANNGGTNDISAFSIKSASGKLSPVAGSPFAAGNSPHALSVTSTLTRTFLYAAGTGGAASTIAGFSVDRSTGRLTAVSGSPFDISVSHYTGVYHGLIDILFATTGDGVASYFGDASTGELVAISDTPTATGVNAFSVAAQQLAGAHLPYLYVANDGAANISGFRVDDLEGTLVEVPGSPFAAGNNPSFMVIL
jgi:DNA-binding beta-propeller fold protein YncE